MTCRGGVVIAIALGACARGEASSLDAGPVAVVPVPAIAPAAEAPPPPPPPADPRAERIELTFTGDIMFGGVFRGDWRRSHVPEHDPLAQVEHLLASDLALSNLETPVIESIPRDVVGELRFGATPAEIQTLADHGIRAVTIANNHANDFGRDGLRSSPRLLAEVGITAIGAAREEQPLLRVETVEVRGWRIGFLAATTIVNRKHERRSPKVPRVRERKLADTMAPLIAAARADHDLIFVLLHWGVELDDTPGRRQVRTAHALIDAGADGVIAHHPHVLQGIERYKGGVIAYSLGNFVFRNARKPQRYTGVLRLGFSRDGACLDLVAFHPAIQRRKPVHHPEPATGDDFDDVAERVIERSTDRPLTRTTWRVDGERLVTAGACD